MATLVSFNAHPDDESIACGGTIARASAEGHRVVVVMATKGELGEVPEGVLAPGEELWERRVEETAEAARVLGVQRVEFLGYRDSGMMGAPSNDAPGSFWQADVEEAARRMAQVVEQERADVLTIVDAGGITGHPDHIQVHRVGVRAAALAGVPRVYETTMSRTLLRRVLGGAPGLGAVQAPVGIDPDRFGTPEELITTVVDVREYLPMKRAAMAAHSSQISETSLFLAMPAEAFVEFFGREWFIRRGAPTGTRETSLFEGLQ
jgi:LmbE family N-acetylglucosaminyl deacetylase